MGGVKTTGTTI